MAILDGVVYDEVEVTIVRESEDVRYREVRYPDDPTARWINEERALRLVGKIRLKQLIRGAIAEFMKGA